MPKWVMDSTQSRKEILTCSTLATSLAQCSWVSWLATPVLDRSDGRRQISGPPASLNVPSDIVSQSMDTEYILNAKERIGFPWACPASHTTLSISHRCVSHSRMSSIRIPGRHHYVSERKIKRGGLREVHQEK
jgi:hypothetical protein